LAGLLHDVGKLILLTHYPTKYKLRFSGSSSGKRREAKEEDLIVDEHATVGAELVRRWRHHSLLADSIHYHHHSVEAVALAFPLVKVVYAANVLAKDESPNDASYARPEISMLELSNAQLERAAETTLKLFEETTTTLGVDLTTAVKDASQAPPSHTDAHTAVTGHVRDTSLLASLSYGLLHAEEADEVIRLVEQTLHGHFDIDRVVFFLIDDEGKSLRAHGQCCLHVGELTVPLSYEKCAPVLALTEERSVECFVASGETDTSIIDEQIVRFLGKEGVVCLPMVVENDPVGTIVLGVDSVDRTALSGQKQFLDRLGKYAGRGLQRCKALGVSAVSRQQDAVKSVVTLTRRAVHEVNNPLSIINNYLTVLSRKLSEHDIAHDEIRIISEEITRIKNILATLVESSKNAAVSMEPVDLNALLSDLLRLMKDDLSIHNGIKVHSNLSSSLPKTLTDRDILKQAIINLLKNSAEALSDGGNIHVETEFVPGDNSADLPTGESGDNGVGKARLIIRDDGPGIPEEIRSQLFQPFVTSKAQHEGLGLSIAHGLIQQLRGTITCDPVTDSGTQFTICLPVVGS
jgi:signal transduction histidine kinase